MMVPETIPANPLARYWLAHVAYNSGEMQDAEYDEALSGLIDWRPITAQDFLDKFLAMFCDAGWPTEETFAAVYREAQSVARRA
jgi:hypothetical protein